LASWGVSLLWRYTPPEIAVRIANPELSIKNPELSIKNPELSIKQEAPIKKEPSQQPSITGALDAGSQTGTGDVIKREVTVFSFMRHGPGTVATGWNYKDGSGGVPVSQFCYYTAIDLDHSSKKIDIAANRIPRSDFNPDLVPDLEGALAKCQWWPG